MLRSGRLVFDLGQLANVSLLPRRYARVYASRLVKKGLARRVVEGVISFTDDPFVISTQLVEPSYVSFTSALYLRGQIRQAPAFVECVTTRNSLKFPELGIEYHRIIPQLYFGYERMERYGSYVYVATSEKAALDMVYHGLYYETPIALDVKRVASLAGRFAVYGGNRGRRVTKWVREHAG